MSRGYTWSGFGKEDHVGVVHGLKYKGLAYLRNWSTKQKAVKPGGNAYR